MSKNKQPGFRSSDFIFRPGAIAAALQKAGAQVPLIREAKIEIVNVDDDLERYVPTPLRLRLGTPGAFGRKAA